MNETEPPFKVGEIVETIKGAKFWGEVCSVYRVPKLSGGTDWRCDVYAIDPGFEGTLHVYPATQLARRPAPHAVGLEGVREALDGMEVVAQSIQSGIRHDSPEGTMKMHVNRLEELIRQAHGAILSALSLPPPVAGEALPAEVEAILVQLDKMEWDRARRLLKQYRAHSAAPSQSPPAGVSAEAVEGDSVPHSVYLSAVKGRVNFRQALKEARAELAALRASSPAPAAQGETVEALLVEVQAAIAECLLDGGVVLLPNGTPASWWDKLITAQQKIAAVLRSEGRGTEGWQDISTAPKDGTWIELWRTPATTNAIRWAPRVIARWHEFEADDAAWVWPDDDTAHPWTVVGREHADAQIAKGDCCEADDSKFTHWRPLPEPPSSTKKEG